jgi:hypothetical protein
VASDGDFQQRHRELGGYVGRSEQSLLSASHLLIEPVKKPMDA